MIFSVSRSMLDLLRTIAFSFISGAGSSRLLRSKYVVKNFFTRFSEPQQKGDLDVFQDEIVEIIKEDLWPNPLTFFQQCNVGEGEDDCGVLVAG
ncbi:hypothetical protein Vadar_021369 [Vaccinium darrowii]|uniref:Uncharacterized protein n=1 Tax=Vaccinium darrowii TaxID=229202 RepID=A0ACB7Y1E1_9ERIC|nr:hypothetical protein Vadar_021369 [Vaccinium darrowii]